MNVDKDIDLDLLFFTYTTTLNRSEDDFWNSTVRKIYSQLDIYLDVNKPAKNKKNTDGKTGSFIEGETITLKGCDS